MRVEISIGVITFFDQNISLYSAEGSAVQTILVLFVLASTTLAVIKETPDIISVVCYKLSATVFGDPWRNQLCQWLEEGCQS